MQWHPPNTYPIRKQAMHNAHHYLKTAYHGTANTEYTLPTDWGQGRAGFGGLIAGMMIAAMLLIFVTSIWAFRDAQRMHEKLAEKVQQLPIGTI